MNYAIGTSEAIRRAGGIRPSCHCHAEPMKWQKDGNVIAGGRWKCGVKDKLSRYRSVDKVRDEFLAAYGCRCIGTADGRPCRNVETRPDALTIGHLMNDGKAHRDAVGKDPIDQLRDLRDRGWPKDVGIGPQCGSCQMIDVRMAGRAARLKESSVDALVREMHS